MSETPPAPAVTGEIEKLFWQWWHKERQPEDHEAAAFHAGYNAALSSPNAPQAEAVVTEADDLADHLSETIQAIDYIPYREWPGSTYARKIAIANGSTKTLKAALSALRQHQSEVEALREAFMRLCEALGIPATAGAWLEANRILERATKAEAENARLKEALKRIDDHVSHGIMGDWAIALKEIRNIARQARDALKGME